MWFSLNTLFGWLLVYRYEVLLPIAIIEGPIISVIAGFLVSIHQMGFWAAFGILLLGDTIGDLILYGIGRWGRNSMIERWGQRFGATPERMDKFEKMFKNHPKKTLLFGKWGHAFGLPILISAGAARENLREFIEINLVGTIPKTLLFLLIGFYFGSAYESIDRYFLYAAIVFTVLIAVVAAIYWFSGKATSRYFDELS